MTKIRAATINYDTTGPPQNSGSHIRRNQPLDGSFVQAGWWNIRMQPINWKGKIMNWNQIEGNWEQFSGKIQQQWGELTNDDLDVIAGNRKQLVGKIQERYGRAEEEVDREIDAWLAKQHMAV